MKRITDPSFIYVPSHETNIRKLFKRVREEQRKARELETGKLARQVIPITERKA